VRLLRPLLPQRAHGKRCGSSHAGTEDGEHPILRDVPAEALFDTVPEFRRVPNLFEILSYEYWRLNPGFVPAPGVADRRAAYLATETGRAHVLAVVGNKLRAAGRSAEEVEAMPEEERIEAASGFFGGGHDVIIARRHFADGAQDVPHFAARRRLLHLGRQDRCTDNLIQVQDLF
jgi:hypothetical protein